MSAPQGLTIEFYALKRVGIQYAGGLGADVHGRQNLDRKQRACQGNGYPGGKGGIAQEFVPLAIEQGDSNW